MEKVEITFEGYMETLEHLKYDDLVTAFSGYRGYDAWDLFVLMVRHGDLDLSKGPLAVIREFSDNAEIVYEDDFADKYPKYSSVMTWDEFVRNECICGDESAAVLSMGE